MNKNKKSELTKEQLDQIKKIKLEKKLLPKAYKEWKTDIKSSIKHFKIDEWKQFIISCLFELILIPLNCVIAFLYSQFQNHDYARKYKKTTGKYPNGYMMPELCLVVSFAVLGVLLVDYNTNSSLQKANQNMVETLDGYSKEDGIHIDPLGVVLGPLGYTEYRSLTDKKYSENNEEEVEIRDANNIPEVTSSPTEYNNIVTIETEEEPSSEYGYGEGLREVIG